MSCLTVLRKSDCNCDCNTLKTCVNTRADIYAGDSKMISVPRHVKVYTEEAIATAIATHLIPL